MVFVVEVELRHALVVEHELGATVVPNLSLLDSRHVVVEQQEEIGQVVGELVVVEQQEEVGQVVGEPVVLMVEAVRDQMIELV